MNSFEHKQTAHCESGVLSSLLTHCGISMSEPMVFGISASLAFVFLPMVKLNNMPLISYREMPKNMVRKIPKILNVSMVSKKYTNEGQANEHLRNLLREGRIVGLQTSVFYLPYFPKDMRFHFNAHNLIVVKEDGEDYWISDPVFEKIQKCHYADLSRARFAKGIFAPKGFLYYFEAASKPDDLAYLIKKAIHKNAKKMLTPFPYAGVNGMKKLAQRLNTLHSGKHTQRYIINYLTHIIRMQEEIGTGGGGFRYLYAAFLQEAKNHGLDKKKLDDAIELIVQSGDLLRKMALLSVQSCKNTHVLDCKPIAKLLLEVAALEKKAFCLLKNI